MSTNVNVDKYDLGPSILRPIVHELIWKKTTENER